MPDVFGKIKKFIAGIIAANADNDPAGVTAYSVGGAQTGYSQIWLMVLAIPMLISVQSMCARIGKVTGKGLGTVLKEQFPKSVAYISVCILVITTIIAIGADFAGIGAAFELIFNFEAAHWLVPAVGIGMWLLVLFVDFETISRVLAWIVLFFFAYVLSAFLSKPDWAAVGKGLMPSFRFDFDFIASAMGILGATITPTVFFWQAEEQVEEKKSGSKQRGNMNLRLAPGFIFAQLIVIFIMIATAATLHAHNLQIQTAADAAKALEPLVGSYAKYLFAIGIIGAGLIAVPVMAAATGYMVGELFNWPQSLSARIRNAKGFYVVITLSLLAGILFAFSKIDPIKALVYSQILAGAVAPLLILLLLIIANRKNIMGTSCNSWFDNLFGIICFVTMEVCFVIYVIQWVKGG